MSSQATSSFASVIRASFCLCRPLETLTQHDPSCATAFETGASHFLCWSDVTQRKIAFLSILFPLLLPVVTSDGLLKALMVMNVIIPLFCISFLFFSPFPPGPYLFSILRGMRAVSIYFVSFRKEEVGQGLGLAG